MGRDKLLRRIKETLSTGKLAQADLSEEIRGFLADTSSTVPRTTKTTLLCEAIRLESMTLASLALKLNGGEVPAGILKLAFNARGVDSEFRVNVLELLLDAITESSELGTRAVQDELASEAPSFEVVVLLTRYAAKIGESPDEPVHFDTPELPPMSPMLVCLFSGSVSSVKVLLNDRNVNAPLPAEVYAFLARCRVTPVQYTTGVFIHRYMLNFWDDYVPMAAGAAPLTLAILNSSRAMVRTLLDHGADLGAVNSCNQTALDVAVACEKKLYTRWLLQWHGVTVVTMAGDELWLDAIPAEWAVSHGRASTVALKDRVLAANFVADDSGGLSFDLALLNADTRCPTPPALVSGRRIARAGRRRPAPALPLLPGGYPRCNTLTYAMFEIAVRSGTPLEVMLVYRG